MIIACCWTCFICRGLSAQPERPFDELPTARIRQSWPTACAKRTPIVSPAMSSSDIVRYSELLELSSAQTKYLEFLYEQYRGRCRDVDQAIGKSVAAAIDAELSTSAQPSAFNTQIAALEAKRTLSEEVARQDDALFEELEKILSERQREHLTRVRLHRQRNRCNTLYFTVKVASAHVDLVRWIETRQFGESISKELDAALWEYERALTPLRVQLVEQGEQIHRDQARRSLQRYLDAQARAEKGAEHVIDPAPMRIIEEGLAETRRKAFITQKKIAEINEEYFPRVIALLSEAHARRLRAAYDGKVHGRVYPDWADPRELFEQMMKSADMSDEVRPVLQEQWATYRKSYDGLCALMCAASDRWQERGALDGTIDGWNEYNKQIVQWVEDRARLNENFMRHLSGLLPAPVLESNEREIERWKRVLESVRKQAQRQRNTQAVDFL